MSSGGGASGEERCLSEIYRTVFVFILRERLPYVLLLVSVLYSLQPRYNRTSLSRYDVCWRLNSIVERTYVICCDTVFRHCCSSRVAGVLCSCGDFIIFCSICWDFFLTIQLRKIYIKKEKKGLLNQCSLASF